MSSASSSFHFIDSEEEACADSGATHVMLPDCEAFLSLHRCHHRTVTLGDESVVAVCGEGLAVISLNRKTILLRGALYIPALRNPLYSLRKHKAMPSCGTFLFHGMGSHILFPHFTLQIDDSVDNIVSYRPIRAAYDPLDYTEPRASRITSRPALIINSPSLQPTEPTPDAVPP